MDILIISSEGIIIRIGVRYIPIRKKYLGS